MWTHDKARQVVAAYLEAATDGGGVILDDQTIDKSYGWIFHYSSKRYQETGNPIHNYAGHGPIVFNRLTGEYTLLPSPRHGDVIAKYEEDLPPIMFQMKPQVRER